MSASESVQPKTGPESPPQVSQLSGQASAIVIPFHSPLHVKAVIAVAHPNGAIASSSSSQVAQLSQLEGQASATDIPFHSPLHVKAVIAVAQPNGAIAASSSLQSLSTATVKDNT